MSSTQPLSHSYSGGCYIGFNAAIDRKAAEQIAVTVGDAVRNKFTEVNLLLSSTGGILDHTYYLCAILDALPVKIIAYNIGNVMSAANLLYLCADERYAVNGSTFYFHQTSYPPPNDQISSSFARSRAKAISRDDARSAAIVSSKIGRPIKEIRRWQRSELFMDTDAALAHGIIHGVKAPVIGPDAFFFQLVI